jgi:hypothetical protein
MKKVIKLLKQAKEDVVRIEEGEPDYEDLAICEEAINSINAAIDELQSPPRFYTPEQWEKRTGEPWQYEWPVWYRGENIGKWFIRSYGTVPYGKLCVVFTEAGPPPDGWRPDEEV